MLGVVLGALPRRRRQAIARVSVSALVASLPLLYLSLLRPPPAALAGDTAFWFLMSNCVIAAIVATADDAAGTLFFGSSNDDENPRDDRNDHVYSCGQQPVVPLAVDDPAAVVTMEAVAVQEGVDRTAAAGSNPTADPVAASPFLIQTESGDAANHMHVSVVQRGEQRHEAATIEPSTDKNNTAVMVVRDRGEEDGGRASHTAASDRALAEPEPPETEAESEPEPEPWVVPKLVTSKSLPDQEVKEDEGADEEWPAALVLAHDKGGKLRRSATTDGSKPVEEEKDYWELSDEELNMRVEDFIARFNRQMRLQIEQEAGV